MSRETGIEWTDATWNPIRGCSRVSEGCRNCYAEAVANRFCGPGSPYEGVVQIGADGKGNGKWNGEIKFVEKHLLDPLRWKKGRRIFANSMSDLFHENVTDEMLDRIFAVMALCPQHTFQVLTKRPERQKEYLSKDGIWHRIKIASEAIARERKMSIDWSAHRHPDWLSHIHHGVSVENQAAADLRIPLLLQTPAAVRFLSCEPLLGAVDLENLCAHALSRAQGHEPDAEELEEPWKYSALNAGDMYWGGSGDISDGPEHGSLDWVIVGGESGPGARPMHPDWARSLRDQCVAAGVPFFFKQWGEWAPGENVERASGIVETAKWFDGKWSFDKENLANDEGHIDDEPDVYRVGKKAAGALLDGREWREMPLGIKEGTL